MEEDFILESRYRRLSTLLKVFSSKPSKTLVHKPRLTLVKKIGTGASSNVYLAELRGKSNLKVAVKTPHKRRRGGKTSAREAREREMEMLKKFQGPFVVGMIGQCLKNQGRILVLELCPCNSKTFFNHINPNASEEFFNSVLKITLGVCIALKSIHGKGYIHRDLKPENILIGNDGLPKLIDFEFTAKKGSRYHRETNHKTLGTMYFVDPKAMKKEGYDESSDMFSLGITISTWINQTSARKIFGDFSWVDIVDIYRRGSEMSLFTLEKVLMASISRSATQDFKKRFVFMSKLLSFSNKSRPTADECIAIMEKRSICLS